MSTSSISVILMIVKVVLFVIREIAPEEMEEIARKSDLIQADTKQD